MWILNVRLLRTKAWLAVLLVAVLFTVQQVEEMAVAQQIPPQVRLYQQGGPFVEGVTFGHGRKHSASLYYSSWHAPLFWTQSLLSLMEPGGNHCLDSTPSQLPKPRRDRTWVCQHIWEIHAWKKNTLHSIKAWMQTTFAVWSRRLFKENLRVGLLHN